jgi:septation ring formation regulator EzrA
MVDNLKNPLDEMYNWIKGEIYDIQALVDSVETRDKLEKKIKKLEQKKKDLQTDFENVS